MSTYSRIVENITRKKVEKQSRKNSKEAVGKHKAHLSDVEKALSAISRKIEAEKRKTEIDWGDVGAMAKTSRDLKEILEFLG
jgi:SpoVK/Ycf46/Vps4 family AAA+-type ATPase